jgi:hypothetical protein
MLYFVFFIQKFKEIDALTIDINMLFIQCKDIIHLEERFLPTTTSIWSLKNCLLYYKYTK